MSTRSSIARPLSLLVVGLLLLLISPVGLASAGRSAATQEEVDDDGGPLGPTTMTVNVELILDASGSMAEALPGSETQSRMEAAKAAMRDVIERIPERAGLNVGFRIYGHEGSNSAEDRELSCRSTELLVPIDGVAKERLLAQVETFQPTGWTPLALALEEAAADFVPGGESITNAVIMVTDGEETCGGDPCKVAAQLNAAEVELTTHVVGFALTPEQREAVRCIAEEGGGELFTADDAAELGEAVFTAFSEVEVAPTPVEIEVETEVGGYVGGNAFSSLDEGQNGELSVVAVGRHDGRHLPIVVRNTTGETVQRVEVSAIARVSGELVAAGKDQGLHSTVVEDGGLAFGDVYFREDLPADAEFEFELSAEPATEAESTHRDLIVEEVNATDDSVVGVLGNPHDLTVGDPVINVALACFDETGQLLDVGEGPANKDSVEPGETTPFEFGLPEVSAGLDTESCPIFLAAGGGHAQS